MGRILWLASYPKSGNTWLRAFLHNLIHDRGGPLDLDALSQSTLMDAGREHYEPLLDKAWHKVTALDAALLRPRVQAAIAASRKGTVMVKTHTMLTRLSGVPSHDPDLTAGAIYIVRDPRDIAVSYADHLGIAIDATIDSMATPDAVTYTTRNGVAEFLGSWSQHVTSWTAQEGPTVLVLRYEDMLADPETAFGRVAAFLHLDTPPALLSKAIANTGFEQLVRLESGRGFRERSPEQARFFRKGRAGGWRVMLTPHQSTRIAADHGPVMRGFGYLDDEGP